MFYRRVAGLRTSVGALGAIAILVCGAGCDSGKGNPAGTGGAGGGGAGGSGVRAPQTLTILHTNDIHSHLMGHSPEVDYSPATLNDDTTVGGMARLVTAINAAKATAAAAAKPVLLLDSGDFTMGTLFEFLETQKAPELLFMQSLGYDATTIGNHELDWTPHGLAGILSAAVTGGVTIPILASNMKFSASDAGDDELEALAGAGVIQKKLVKTVGTLKVGFFGLLGADAVTVTPQVAPLTFDPIATAAAAAVADLRQNDKVDLVIALSHSGISSTGTGEDAGLAQSVPGIDIIISGHTHETLAQPVKVGDTWIVNAGAYSQFVGEMQLTVTPAATAGGIATLTVDDYKLVTLDDSIVGDTGTQQVIDAYIGGLDAALTPLTGLSYKKVLASTTTDLTLPTYAEATVGDLVTDAYRAVSAAVQPTDPPLVAVEANGQLRSPVAKGKTGQIWFADLFRVTPIGIGPNAIPGYPLVTFYLNAKDIASGLELGAAPEALPDQYFLQLSGIKVRYDMTKPLFNRVAALSLSTAAGDVPLVLGDVTTCYKVVATNYVAGLLGVVKTFTGGLLSVNAKDKDCATLVDPTTRFVDADPVTAGVQELKHWQAVAKYVTGLPDTNADGIPDVPAAYGAVQGRITKQ